MFKIVLTWKYLDYICTCNSGLKVVGTCVHVAALIYYFSNSSFRELKLPGEHLNYIFENDLYNRPQYIKNKRGRRDFSSSSDSLSTHSQSPQPPVSLEEWNAYPPMGSTNNV